MSISDRCNFSPGGYHARMANTPKTPHSAASLRLVVDQLQEIATTLSMVAKSMEQHDFKEILATHHSPSLEGLRSLDEFGHSAKQSLRDQLKDRGHFQAGPTEPHNFGPKETKKKK